MRLSLAIVMVLLAPTALAVDLLPTEVSFTQYEARILVRSAVGVVSVETEPVVLAGASAPGGTPDGLAETPRSFDAGHVWHGLDGIVVVVLRRAASDTPVEVIIEDGTQPGIWVQWPAMASAKRVPGLGAGGALFALAFALAGGLVGRGRW